MLLKCVQPLDVKLKRSILLAVFLWMLVIISVSACLLANIAIQFQVVLIVVASYIARSSFNSIFCFNKLVLKPTGYWYLHTTKGIIKKAVLSDATTVFPGFMSMCFKVGETEHINMLLTRDSLINKNNWSDLRFSIKVYKKELLSLTE